MGMKRGATGIVFVACLLAASATWAQVRPVLTLTFDEDFDGAGPKGVVKGALVDKPLLVPGKWGQVLKSGPTLGYVEYPMEGILNPDCGTVEMWVCPVDWSPDDEKFHVFFETRDQGFLCLYKYWVGTDLLTLTCSQAEGPFWSSRFPVGDWKQGEWRFLAATWSHRGVRCYVNGKPAGKDAATGELPKQFGKTFRIGDHPWQFARTSSSLIDEVRVYDRALSPAYLAAHFAGSYDFAVPLTRDAIELDYKIDCLSATARVSLDISGAESDDSRMAASVTLIRKGAAAPDSTKKLRFVGGSLYSDLALPSGQPGDYEVVARIFADGEFRYEKRAVLVIPKSEWLGNRLGLDDKVLPPWTPLRVQSSELGGRNGVGTQVSIECWGRKYVLNGLLPDQTKSAGAEVLSRPVSLRVTSNGSEAVWRQSVRVVSSSPTRVELQTGATAKVGGADAEFAGRLTAEYDGLLLFELSCKQPDKLPLDGVTIEIPVKAEHALYRHLCRNPWETATGFVPAGAGVVDKAPFIPYAWLGDNDRGLFWFCESDEGWPNGQSDHALEIVRSGKEVVLRLNLLTKGQKLPADWRFVFGLQATPVKPLPKNWRRWRMTPGRNANVEIVWPSPVKHSLAYFGYPEAAEDALFSAYIRDLHTRGFVTAPYLCLTYTTAGSPEWRYYHKVWEMGCTDPSPFDFGWTWASEMASPAGKGYADFIVWKNKQFVDRFGIDGLYHDCTNPYFSQNTDAGVGYLRDGVRRNASPILGYRSLYRRMYAVMKALPRPTFTMAHMSSNVTIPVLAYEDACLDGEHFVGRVKESYLDLITLDHFRAEFMGRQWGFMPFFLPEFRPPYSDQVEPTRGLMALLMLHDVSLWPIWCNTKVANESLEALDEFGYVESEFLPYFDPTPPGVTEMKDVYISAYKRSDGRALLVVGNVGKEDRSGEVQINLERIGLKPRSVLSWPDKQPLELVKGRLKLDVPRLGYKMIVISDRR